MKEIGRYKIFIAFVFIAEDIIALNLLYFSLIGCFELNQTNKSYEFLLIIINLGYLLSVAIKRTTSDIRELTGLKILKHNLYRLSTTGLILLGCLFITKTSSDISRLFISAFFGIAFVLLFLLRWLTRKVLTYTIGNNKSISKAIILGAGLIGEKLYTELSGNVYLGIKILGFFDDNPAKRNESHILGSLDQVKEYIKNNHITTIYCTLPLSAKNKILDFLNFAEQNVINFHIVPAIAYYTNAQIVLDNIGNIPILSIRKVPLSHTHNALIKRALDIIISFMFLITLFPVIYLIFGMLIKLSSPGPIFFVQERTGFKGKKFNCYKFRSMRCNNEAHTKQATANDNRKTRIGNFIRRTNIDELPQFVNVLKGNMSLVGPRPHMLLHTTEYSRLINKYMVRHFIKPGITGWAQINGFRGETTKLEEMEGRIKKDIWYIENWSIWLDVKIVFKTVFVMLIGDKKAY
jgi:putative colanic acid biosynthesis UDP-glucose lipid carrier transferase